MSHNLQGLFIIIPKIPLDLDMILYQFLNQLVVNTMIHLVIPFFHHLIQIFKQIILRIFLSVIIFKGHNTHAHIYYKQIPRKVIFLHKIKKRPIQTSYNLFKENLKILHFPIYLLILYIK